MLLLPIMLLLVFIILSFLTIQLFLIIACCSWLLLVIHFIPDYWHFSIWYIYIYTIPYFSKLFLLLLTLTVARDCCYSKYLMVRILFFRILTITFVYILIHIIPIAIYYPYLSLLFVSMSSSYYSYSSMLLVWFDITL